MKNQYSTVDTSNQGIISVRSWASVADRISSSVQPLVTPKRFDSLQSMRLLASLAVFQSHLWTNYLGRSFVHPGTDFFIVLVGMVAALNDAGKITQGDWKNYLLRRYLRLYVTFIPIFLLYVLGGRDELTPDFLIRSFFFIPSPGRMPLVGPTWMLAMFLAFYWLFSLAFLSHKEATLIPVFTAWGVSCLLVTALDVHVSVFDKGFQLFFSLPNLQFIAGYIGGWLVRNGFISGPVSRRLLWVGILLMLAGVVVLNSGEHGVSLRVMLYGASMTLIAVGLASMERVGVDSASIRTITHPWLVWLGGASYVLYLTHNMILRIWDSLLPIMVWQAPLITLAALSFAAIGYQFWEKPVLVFFRTKVLGRE